jgi:lambda family phage portal protein
MFERVRRFAAGFRRGSNAVELAKAEAVKELAKVAGEVMRSAGRTDGTMRADGDYPSSENIGSSTSTPGYLDTAHRGASQNTRSLLNWGVTAPVDGNLETVYDIYALRARSADLCRNNPIARGAVNRKVQKVVGSGLTVHPSIDREFLGLSDEEADEWERDVKALFDKVAGSTDLDLRGTETFAGLQELAFRSVLERGEVFALLPVRKRPGTLCNLKLQLVEADRVTNPQLTYDTLWRMSGIETDIDGLPVAYWVETTPSWLNVVRTWARVPARGEKSGRPNVLHVYRQQRIGDKRGIPMLSPVIETLKQLSRYTEAELMAAVISSMFTVFVKTLTGDNDDLTADAMPPALVPTAGDADPGLSSGTHVKPIAMGNGAIVELAEGEDISTANPGRPNPNYEPYVTALIRQVGMAVDIPFEVLMQHFSSSYSASRAALIEMWDAVMTQRAWFADGLCQPTYEEWLAEMVLSGRIRAPGFFASEEIRRSYCRSEWIGAAMPQLDPVKESTAADKRVASGYSTIERETRALNGSSWERNFRQRAKEEALRKQLGLDFSTNINPITGADDGQSESDSEQEPQSGQEPEREGGNGGK